MVYFQYKSLFSTSNRKITQNFIVKSVRNCLTKCTPLQLIVSVMCSHSKQQSFDTYTQTLITCELYYLFYTIIKITLFFYIICLCVYKFIYNFTIEFFTLLIDQTLFYINQFNYKSIKNKSYHLFLIESIRIYS